MVISSLSMNFAEVMDFVYLEHSFCVISGNKLETKLLDNELENNGY